MQIKVVEDFKAMALGESDENLESIQKIKNEIEVRYEQIKKKLLLN